MALFRCLNCTNAKGLPGREFEAGKPECPICHADLGAIVELEIIHYDPPSGKPGRGLRRAACDPTIKIGHAGPKGCMFSGEPSAVTCRACMATDVFRVNAELRGVPVIPAHLDQPA